MNYIVSPILHMREGSEILTSLSVSAGIPSNSNAYASSLEQASLKKNISPLFWKKTLPQPEKEGGKPIHPARRIGRKAKLSFSQT